MRTYSLQKPEDTFQQWALLYTVQSNRLQSLALFFLCALTTCTEVYSSISNAFPGPESAQPGIWAFCLHAELGKLHAVRAVC